jgi:DNA processing protein
MAVDLHDEYRAALALRHSKWLGPRTWRAIAEHFDSLVEAARNCRSWHALGLANKRQADAFAARSWKEEADKEYEAARRNNARIILITEGRFPELLRQIPDPPLYLYYKGDAKLLHNPCVGIVGARKCSSYGLEAAMKIGMELSRYGVTIVSGFASGIDRQVHLAGVSGVGSSIAVLGTGLDVIYPQTNRDVWRTLESKGLILTEYGYGVGPEAGHFPVRNRIISGLSLGVLVAEAAGKSGSLITANHALEQGREVFALPGPVGKPTFTGCHALIRQGGCLVSSAGDIVQELRYVLGPEALTEDISGAGISDIGPDGNPLNEPELKIADALADGERLHIDQLGRLVSLKSGEVSRLLLELELKGLVRQWPGMYYSLV